MTSASKRSVKKACMTCGQEYADAPDKCPFDGTALATIGTELSPGEVLCERYEIICAVAAGGMGQIYKAKHLLMNRMVAIKTIHLSLMSGGAGLQRFQQETQAISALNHPNILTVFDFFISDEGQPYLVMDYLQGTNLQEVLKAEKRIELARALPILIEACAGFEHAHEHGVIHRDIKPANIMLVNFAGNSDFVKIVDFGIAKLTPETGESRHLTATGDTFGSPEYMSPEQCRAKMPDARSDIYSLGCVMYVLLTGASPFKSQDPMEIMYKQVHDSPPPPSKVCPEANLSEALDAVVLKAIQKDPEQRFQSMEEMRLALAAISAIPAKMSAPAAQKTTNNPVVTAKIEPLADSETIAPPQTVAVKNQSIAAKAAIGLTLVAVIVIAVGVYKQSKTESKSSTTTTTTSSNSSTTNTSPANQTQASPARPSAQTPATQAPAISAVTPPAVTVNTQVQQIQQARSSYESNFKNGESEFRAKHFPEARLYFQSAHKAAETFGQNDTRFVNSLYWISKCDLSNGNYQQALAGLEFVSYAQKRQFGANSREVRTTEGDLQAAKRALKR